MITDKTARVPIADIKIDREARQRREFSTIDLESSIQKIGLLNPIIVNSGLWLQAGERRLEACRRLGHLDILVRFAEDLSEIESQILELEENIKREDLEWQDQVRAVQRVHQLHLALDPDWLQEDTGKVLSLTQGTISMYLRVAPELGEERIAKAGTIREAHNVLLRRDQRAAGDALQELLDTPDNPPVGIHDITTNRPGLFEPGFNPRRVLGPGLAPPPEFEDSILQSDFLTFAASYKGPKFSVLHCDFPYGIDFSSGPQGLGSETATYGDSKDVYFALLEALCVNLDRLMSVSGHLLFWYSAKHFGQTMEIFNRLAPSLSFCQHPLIWIKSDNAGIASDALHTPRHVYETCLFATRGKRPILKVISDAYSAPTDKRLHVSTKPEPMLRHFMQMVVDENTTVFDPTCGSGAALRAAESLGARSVLGLEIDAHNSHLAQQALLVARRARRAAEAVAT